MRRGGGSRGGGGSFGGSRGGGSSRMHRSSRRHYGHSSHYGRHRHHGYYGGGYYGGGYYGGRRHSGGGGTALLIFLVIILMIVAAVFAGIMSAPDTYQLELEGQTTYALDYSSFTDNTVQIEAVAGSIQIFMFENEPPIAGTVDLQQSESSSLVPNNYEYFGLTLTENTEMQVTWTADHPLSYYAIRGDSNLNSWEDGNDNEFYSDYGETGTHRYTVSRDDTYYFAVESGSLATTYSMTFDMSLPVHDLTNPLAQFSGSQTLEPSDIPGESIVIYNPTPNSAGGTDGTGDDASVTITVTKDFGFGTIFFGIMIIGGLIIFVIRRSSNTKSKRSTPSPTSGSTSTASVSSSTQVMEEKPAKPIEGYTTRPSAKFCNNCGSGLLPDSKFCIECGQSV